MLGMKLDASQGVRKIRELVRKVARFQDTKCTITPTQVLYYLSDMKGEVLLGQISSKTAADVRKRWTPKVEAAVKAAAPPGQRIDDMKVSRAWRYGAYVYVEKLWADVLRGSWGKVQPETRAVKAYEAAAEKARRPPRKAKAPPAEGEAPKPRAPRKPSTRAKGGPRANGIDSFGVRSRERNRRWYDIQKGKKKHGRRTDGELVESKPLIEVFQGARKIGEV
jgi:hypothetical protein